MSTRQRTLATSIQMLHSSSRYSYYCLSYCWSNPHVKSNVFNQYDAVADEYDDQSVYPISCNGRLLYVRANLYDALQQLPAAPGLQLKRWYNFNGTFDKCTDLHISAAEGDLALTKFVLPPSLRSGTT